MAVLLSPISVIITLIKTIHFIRTPGILINRDNRNTPAAENTLTAGCGEEYILQCVLGIHCKLTTATISSIATRQMQYDVRSLDIGHESSFFY